jgi:ATP-dependent DNA helicase DinG
MSLISQDTQRDQKYTFAEKSSSGPLRTRVNRLRGMPVLFTTRVIDDTRALRFDEKNRRFINVTPDTSSSKIRAANKLIGLKCGSLPQEYDDLVVSRSDRERCKRIYVLNEIAAAYASGYEHILLEAPTGFGKSPAAIAIALTSGTSYICTATKDLQAQYTREFPFVKAARGRNNFLCSVKDDFIRNGTYKCTSGSCVSNNANECRHTSAEYGPCISNESFKKGRCKYRTFAEHYKIEDRGTREEKLFIDYDAMNNYQNEYSQWLHFRNLKNQPIAWRPCEYYHQLNITSTSSHSILNYPFFLSLLANEKILPTRELLVLDEAHLLETEIVKFTGISISKKTWKRYIPDLKMADYGYDDIEKWIEYLIELKTKMFDLTGGINEDLAAEAIKDTEELIQSIDNIHSNPKNWIVSEIRKEGYEVTRVELKPLDVSHYCQSVFKKCNKTLMMSKTNDKREYRRAVTVF